MAMIINQNLGEKTASSRSNKEKTNRHFINNININVNTYTTTSSTTKTCGNKKGNATKKLIAEDEEKGTETTASALSRTRLTASNCF